MDVIYNNWARKDLIVGCEYYGLAENFDAKRVKCCGDWEIDAQFEIDHGEEAGQEYREAIKTDGRACGHCLWRDDY